MSKKSPLIFLSLFVLAGIALASGLLFPDTPGLPRFPTEPGTIGGFLASPWFHPDGTVVNTEALFGVTASGYLKNTNCDPLSMDNVWVGVDILGQARCGHRITPLAMIGKFTYIDGNVEVLKVGSSTPTPANLTDALLPGDIVMTNDGSGTITFEDDLSILRLDPDTVVDLRTGSDLAGNSIAEAILKDGSLWGRVLSNTGINLGGGGMVAGVRGTGLGIEKVGNDFVFSMVDSQGPIIADYKNTAVVGVVSPIPSSISTQPWDHDGDGDSDGVDLMLSWNPLTTQVVGRRIVHPNNSLIIETGATIGKVNLLSGSTWVRENIKKDVVYLDYIAYSGGLDPMVQWKVDNEVKVATPKNAQECINTLNGKVIQKGKHAIPGAGMLTSTPCTTWSSAMSDDDKRNSTICAIEGRNYWQSLSGTSQKCQEPSILAFADYTTGDNKMYYSSYSGSMVPTYEKYTSQYIEDDGWFAGAKCDPGIIFGFHIPAWDNPKTILPGFPDAGKNIYVTNPSLPINCAQLLGKDKFKYDAVWDRTTPSGWVPGISGSGITVTGTGYIAYPLSLLPTGLPTAITGKTMVIRVDAAHLLNTSPHLDQYLLSVYSAGGIGVWLYHYPGGPYNKLHYGNYSGAKDYLPITGTCRTFLMPLSGQKVDILVSQSKLELLDINGTPITGCIKTTSVDLFKPTTPTNQLVIGSKFPASSFPFGGSVYSILIKN